MVKLVKIYLAGGIKLRLNIGNNFTIFTTFPLYPYNSATYRGEVVVKFT